jgi:hypothetical protein
MSKETKRVECDPSGEETLITFYQDFGWELDKTNEVYSETQVIDSIKTTGVDDGGLISSKNKVKSHTETTNYVTLLFTRDTLQPRYAELAALEKEYDDLLQQEQDDSKAFENDNNAKAQASQKSVIITAKTIRIIGLIMQLGGLVALFATASSDSNKVPLIVIHVLGIVLVITAIVIFFVSDHKKDLLYDSMKNDPAQEKKFDDLLRQAEQKHKEAAAIVDEARIEAKPAPAAKTTISENEGSVKAKEATSSVADEIKKLNDLKTEGILTEKEFQEQKAKLLAK